MHASEMHTTVDRMQITEISGRMSNMLLLIGMFQVRLRRVKADVLSVLSNELKKE